MVDIYKTNSKTAKLENIEKIEKGCWINMVKPTEEEIKEISLHLKIDEDLLKYPLDIAEKAHIDTDDDDEAILIVVDSPVTEISKGKNIYTTLPIGMILVRDETFITISQVKINVIENILIRNKTSKIRTRKKSRLVFQILFDMAKDYIKYLTYINKDLEKFEESMEKTMSNKELMNILSFEKTMIYFNASVKANQVVLEKLNRGKSITLYEEDSEILEDTIIENRQAIEMIQTYSEILNGIVDIFGTIVSNNLNIVMKFLTAITVILAVPTLISSFIGMNVKFPFNTEIIGFYAVTAFSILVTVISALLLKKKGLL
ncbi:MAG: magnesium transporter CorA family protein [Clostridia bacterium]